MFARLVGEGYERPDGDDQLPLDVNYQKVSEWLIDRRLLPTDWTRKLAVIQAKAADAAKELPPGFMGQFDGGEDAPIDFFRAHEILAKLSVTAERGLLGSFKGAAGSWERILKAYEANMLHVAEGGLTMARNVDFEIPYFKKQAAKNQQLMVDLDRRAAESLKSASAAAADFAQELTALGIAEQAAAAPTPSALRAALVGLTRELPALVHGAVAAAQEPLIGDAVGYYAGFIAATAPSASALPALLEVREGRTEPLKQGIDALGGQPAAGTSGGVLSGSGDADDPLAALQALTGEPAAPSGVSWDLDLPADSEASAAGAISWDFDVVAGEEGDGAAAEPAAEPAGISWDIDVSAVGEDSEAAVEAHALDPAAAAASEDASTSSSHHAAAFSGSSSAEVQRLMADAAYRARFLDDLYELHAFLGQRCAELPSQSQSALAGAPAEVAAVDAAAAAVMRTAVGAVIAALTGPRVLQLLSLATSSQHCGRVAAKLARQGGQEGKFKRAAAEAAARKAEAQRQLVADSAKLAALARRTRGVKSGVEEALGTRLGRRVNVQGEISTALA